MCMWSSHTSENPHLYSEARPPHSACVHLNQIRNVKRSIHFWTRRSHSAVSVFLWHVQPSFPLVGLWFDWSTGRKFNYVGVLPSAAVQSINLKINNSICLLFVFWDKDTGNNILLFNIQTDLFRSRWPLYFDKWRMRMAPEKCTCRLWWDLRADWQL